MKKNLLILNLTLTIFVEIVKNQQNLFFHHLNANNNKLKIIKNYNNLMKIFMLKKIIIISYKLAQFLINKKLKKI